MKIHKYASHLHAPVFSWGALAEKIEAAGGTASLVVTSDPDGYKIFTVTIEDVVYVIGESNPDTDF